MRGMKSTSIAQLRGQLARLELSFSELLQAHIGRITRQNPRLNALPTLCLDRAIEEARQLDNMMAKGRNKKSSASVGPLAGMPYCAKDMFETAGIRTTFGSPLFQDHVPANDSEIVRRIRGAGALLVGKSNTPEFAAGSQTFNTVFGVTRNPWDPDRTCGGSTGGGAVALATEMVCLADGSDLAASLRNPASFCGVTGLRPSSHLDPRLQTGANPFNTLSMVGPMGRSVDDTRELFLAIFDPLGCRPDRSLQQWVELRTQQSKARADQRRGRRLRIGWCPDWGGLPVEHAVTDAMQRCEDQLRMQHIELVPGFPDLPDLRSAFLTLRGEYFVAEFSDLYAQHKSQLKDTVVWNIEQGLLLNAQQITDAQKIRGVARAALTDYMNAHQLDAIAGPTNQVLPFDLNTPYITEINGQPLETYIDWLASNFMITMAGLPAISIPAGFAAPVEGAPALPVGLQLVGRWAEDLELLNVAEAIESVLAPMNHSRRLP